MTYTAIDCQGFAGGFTLGTVQAGFNLIGKREMRGGFGVKNCEVNRHLLGSNWQSESCDPVKWSAPPADLVFGNPPCSGFSVLSSREFRGTDSKINSCMWAFVEFTARVRPQIAIFESVPLAFTQGHSLMRALRERLERDTGESWSLTHVLHNAYTLGGPAQRKRYFWVASRIPFGVERPAERRLPTLLDVIGDLSTLPISWESQPYTDLPTWYSQRFRAPSGTVDGHASADTPHTRRALDVAYELMLHGQPWQSGEAIQSASRRLYELTGKLPDSWGHITEKLIKGDFFQGFNTPTRWRGDQAARVVTGSGPINVIHPTLNRMITFREVARVLGFPDDWLIDPLRGAPGMFMTWGKGITVDCGRWIATWASRALDGEPGSYVGNVIGDNEWLIDVTNRSERRVALKCGTVKLNTPSNREENNVTEVATDVPVDAAPESAGRGRPRPTETIERDQLVFDKLDEPRTREALASLLELDAKLIYLSLYRLRKDGRVQRTRQDGAHVWTRTPLD